MRLVRFASRLKTALNSSILPHVSRPIIRQVRSDSLDQRLIASRGMLNKIRIRRSPLLPVQSPDWHAPGDLVRRSTTQ